MTDQETFYCPGCDKQVSEVKRHATGSCADCVGTFQRMQQAIQAKTTGAPVMPGVPMPMSELRTGVLRGMQATVVPHGMQEVLPNQPPPAEIARRAVEERERHTKAKLKIQTDVADPVRGQLQVRALMRWRIYTHLELVCEVKSVEEGGRGHQWYLREPFSEGKRMQISGTLAAEILHWPGMEFVRGGLEEINA